MKLVKNQSGVSLIAAIFIIVILAFMGVVFLTLFTTTSVTSINELQSTQALYVAEGGMERGVRYFISPTLTERVACASIPSTNTALGLGEFSLTIEAGSPFYSSSATTLSGGIVAGDTTINVGSTAGYAPFGRIMIDREIIDYTGTTANSFTGALRGRGGTTAAQHVQGTRIGQDQCTVTSTGGVYNLTTPNAGRQVRQGIQIQEGWAVGDNGVIIRWNGVTWSLFTTTGIQLRGVSINSYANGWTVGELTGGMPSRAQIREWKPDGTPAWDTVVAPAQATVRLNAVHTLSHNEAWAVGRDRGGGANALTFRWTGAWAYQDPGIDRHIYSVYMLDTNNDGVADDGWAVTDRTNNGWSGNGDNFGFIRWNIPNAGQWNRVPINDPADRERLNSVNIISNQDGWAVGENINGKFTILRWNNPALNTWNKWSFANANNRDLNSVFMISSTDGWAVGDNGVILRWNNPIANVWNVNVVPNAVTGNNLNAGACIHANDCWAVGDAGTILHWDGNSWSVHSQSGVLTGQNLLSISILGPKQRPQAMWREVFQ